MYMYIYIYIFIYECGLVTHKTMAGFEVFAALGRESQTRIGPYDDAASENTEAVSDYISLLQAIYAQDGSSGDSC